MYKKLVIAMKTLGWSGVSNTPKILWYLANHGIQNRVFYMLTKHLSGKIPWYLRMLGLTGESPVW
jgi:hypothetical protein